MQSIQEGHVSEYKLLLKNTPEQLHKPMKEKGDYVAKRVFTFEFIIQLLKKLKQHSEKEEFYAYLRGCQAEVDSIVCRIERASTVFKNNTECQEETIF